MALVKTKGLVLRERPFQDQDRMLTIFTENDGKVKAIAKGVRRTKSPMTAGTQLFAWSSFVYYQGKNFMTLSSADLIEPFYPLRQDMRKMAEGSCVLELLDAFFDDYQGNEDLLKVACHLLYYISEGLCADPAVMLLAFELKCLEVSGLCPNLKTCAKCGSKDNLDYFCAEEGGVICRKCSDEWQHLWKMGQNEAAVLHRLLSLPIKKLREDHLEKDRIAHLLNMMNSTIVYHLNRKMPAYEFYRSLFVES